MCVSSRRWGGVTGPCPYPAVIAEGLKGSFTRGLAHTAVQSHKLYAVFSQALLHNIQHERPLHNSRYIHTVNTQQNVSKRNFQGWRHARQSDKRQVIGKDLTGAADTPLNGVDACTVHLAATRMLTKSDAPSAQPTIHCLQIPRMTSTGGDYNMRTCENTTTC